MTIQTKNKYLILIIGLGRNYLLNEIFYRVSLIRDFWLKSQPSGTVFYSGHFHLPILQFKKGEDIYPELNSSVVNIVMERIKREVMSI